jgi:hypothetical protein
LNGLALTQENPKLEKQLTDGEFYNIYQYLALFILCWFLKKRLDDVQSGRVLLFTLFSIQMIIFEKGSFEGRM